MTARACTHSLQSATRALRESWDDEYIVCALLLHNIGDELSPFKHLDMAAAIFRSYISGGTAAAA
jgi:predicted HD phosphohydrolase